MATNLGQFQRDRFKSGDAAGDGNGDYLREHSLKSEDAASKTFSWLSGGASEVTLPNALPISRGGTGGGSALRARLNLGIFVTTNNDLVFGSKGVSLYEGFVLDHDGTVKPGVVKNGIGDYTVSNVTGFSPNQFTFILPKDELGNLLCGCEITFNTGASVRVYAIKYVGGKAVLDKTVPMDIPHGRCIDISVK